MKTRICFSVLLAMAGVAMSLFAVAGCAKRTWSQPSTLAEAQRLYQDTKWYWADTTVCLSNLPVQYYDQARPGGQLFIKFSNGTCVLYTEFLPRGGMMSWRGTGKLKSVPGVNCPVYIVGDGLEKQTLVGFAVGRMFRVEAKSSSA